jgi:hypothetical protein
MHLRAGHASFLGSTVGRQPKPHREIGWGHCTAAMVIAGRGIIARSRLFLGTVMPTPLRHDEPVSISLLLPRLIAIVGS